MASTYLERYQAGEHEQVWSDLIALGAAVRGPTVQDDALAVAGETMRRAWTNIETLISRLHTLGYQFETTERQTQQSADRLASVTRQMETLRTAVRGPMADKLKGLFDLVSTLQQ